MLHTTKQQDFNTVLQPNRVFRLVVHLGQVLVTQYLLTDRNNSSIQNIISQ